MKLQTLALSILVLCASSHSEEVKIGALYSLTGAGAALGESGRLGATIAVDIINKEKFLHPHKIQLVLEDSQSDPKVALSAFRNLVGIEGVPAVVTNLTSVGMTVRGVADQLKIPIFTDSIHTGLTQGHSFVFRNFFSNTTANDSLLSFMKERSFLKLAILHAEEDIGQEALRDLQSRAQTEGFES